MIKWIKSLFGGPTEPLPTFPSEPEDEYTPQPDQVARKARSEKLLKKQGIPINPYLPMIESEQETSIRSPDETAARLIALMAVAGIAMGDEREAVEAFIEAKGARRFFSERERQFVNDPHPEMRSRIQFSWQFEAALTLLWALKLEDGPLEFPDSPCNVGKLVQIVSEAESLTEKGMRSATEILDEADLVYRYHWALRDAGLKGKEAPGGLHGGVVMERHRALNWLIRYNDEDDWDEVTTDT